MKNNTFIFIGIGILILAVIIIPKIQGTSVVPGITVSYYDAKGNPINFQPYNEQIAMKGNAKSTLSNILGMFGIVSNTNTITLGASASTYQKSSSCTGDNCYISYPGGLGGTILGIGDHKYSSYDTCFNEYFYFNTAVLPPSLQNASQITDINFQYTPNQLFFASSDNQALIGSLLVDFGNPVVSSTQGTAIKNTYNTIMANTNILFNDLYNSASPLTTQSHSILSSLTSTELLKKTGFSIGFAPNNCWLGRNAGVQVGDSQAGVPPTLTVTYNTCQPETCTTLAKQCGTWADTCGGITSNCGTCSNGYTCDVNGQCQNVLYSYQINIVNNGNVPYTNIHLTSTTPSTFLSSFSSTSFGLLSGQSNNFTSSPIDTSSYNNQTFTAYISGYNTYTNKTETFSASRILP